MAYYKDGSIKYGNLLKKRTVSSDDKKNRIVFINTLNGTWLVDSVNLDRYEDYFLSGKQVSCSFIDEEKNFWFTTLGEGVYKLASREFKTVNFNNTHKEIFSFSEYNGRLVAGGSMGNMYLLRNIQFTTLNFDRYLSRSINNNSANRLLCIKKTSAGEMVLGFDGFLLKKRPAGDLINYTYAIKSIDEIDAQSLLVGAGTHVAIVDQKNLATIDTVWSSRSTAVASYNNAYYIGTVNGLYVVKKDKSVEYPGSTLPGLGSRISSFVKTPDGNLWVATFGSGLVQLKGNRFIGQITSQQGLSSDICRTLFLDYPWLWIGTDKGLCKMDLSKPGYPVIKYSTADGLPSNIINAVYTDSSKVYVGSPAGLTFFDEGKIAGVSQCRLQLLNITVSGQQLPMQGAYRLPYNRNNFKVEFAGISFKSGGDIVYRYRLRGLNDEWDSTRQTTLEYPSLPSDNYELQLTAINKFGVTSNQITIPFIIETPFWQTWWFRIAVLLCVAGIVWLIMQRRINKIRRQEREKNALQQRMNDLEQLALRSQMNPHFIFNCLNAIQNFVIHNDLETTNWYLTEFAYLIRQTLDNSDRKTISLQKEIAYLTRYLELEKMRFKNSFTYQIEADAAIDLSFTHIPSMILQPYVENSIRHGVRYREDKNGLIIIRFQQTPQQLVCIVEDNGVGRARAGSFKSALHVEYQSKGMLLTEERINIINRHLPEPITIKIIDLTTNEQAAGTKVVIRFPDSVLDKI